MFKNKMTVGRRMLFGFGLIVVLNLAGMGIVWRNLTSNSARVEQLTGQLLTYDRLANEWAALTRQNGARTIALLSSADPQAEAHYSARIKTTSDRISVIQKSLEASLTGSEGKAFADDIGSKRAAYTAMRSRLSEARAASGKPIAIVQLESELLPLFDSYSQALESYALSFRGQTDRASAELKASNSLMLQVLAVLALLSALLSFFIAWRITLRITRPLATAVAVASAVAEGRLDNSIVALGDAESASMLRALEKMQTNLRSMVASVRSGAAQLTAAATQMAVSSGQVALSSQEQSEAASATSSAVEQMTVSFANVAANADETSAITRRTGDLSDRGGLVMQSAIDEMSKIAEAVSASSELILALGENSNKISTIVLTIKEIADQTNLLALNAAIEAARAGEQGRGFAVVADEVRKLAERTTQSTQEISTMIATIQNGTQGAVASMQEGSGRVSDGVSMARSAGESMNQIRSGTNQVITEVGDITAALREQSTASVQVSQNVERIARMAEANYVSVTAMSDAARHLETLAGKLQASVSLFRI